MKDTYKDVDDYLATFEPLLFEEVKAQIVQDKDDEEEEGIFFFSSIYLFLFTFFSNFWYAFRNTVAWAEDVCVEGMQQFGWVLLPHSSLCLEWQGIRFSKWPFVTFQREGELVFISRYVVVSVYVC